MTPTEYRKQVKAIGRKTTLQDGVEIVSVENQDVIELLHSFLSYEDDSRAKSELEFMSQKLEALKSEVGRRGRRGKGIIINVLINLLIDGLTRICCK